MPSEVEQAHGGKPSPEACGRSWPVAVVRRCGATFAIVAYLSTTAWFGLLHVLGDLVQDPTAYFFTWDMFPFYVTESTRPIAVGLTRSGEHLQLLPGPTQQFRWGLSGKATRSDLDRSRRFLRSAVDHALKQTKTAQEDDPFVRVFVVEEYWPSRFNLTDDLYKAVYNEPNPRRKYWRILDEFEVTADNTLGH